MTDISRVMNIKNTERDELDNLYDDSDEEFSSEVKKGPMKLKDNYLLKEIALALNLKPMTIYQWIYRGKINPDNFNGKRRFSQSTLWQMRDLKKKLKRIDWDDHEHETLVDKYIQIHNVEPASAKRTIKRWINAKNENNNKNKLEELINYSVQ